MFDFVIILLSIHRSIPDVLLFLTFSWHAHCSEYRVVSERRYRMYSEGLFSNGRDPPDAGRSLFLLMYDVDVSV